MHAFQIQGKKDAGEIKDLIGKIFGLTSAVGTSFIFTLRCVGTNVFIATLNKILGRDRINAE